MKFNSHMPRRLTALFLTLVLLLGGLLPAVFAGAAEAEPVALSDANAVSVTESAEIAALRALAAQDTPYELPAEAKDAVHVPLTLLQNGSLAASWPKENLLQSQSSAAEAAFIQALEDFEVGVSLKAYGLTQAQAVNLMNDTINTRPEIFYFNGIYMSLTNGKVDYVWFMYTAALSVVEAQAAVLAAEVDYILSLVPNGLSDAEKVLWVNEHLAAINAYPDITKSLDDYYFNVYGILVEGFGVCQAYALANCLLLKKLSVECTFVTSDQMNHAWNQVKVGGKWYHLDTTWNDGPAEYYNPYRAGSIAFSWDLPGYANHDYLLLSEATLRVRGHNYNDWSTTYTATSTTYENYFWTNTTSIITYMDGKWYYVEDNANGWRTSAEGYKNTYQLSSYDFAAASAASVTPLTQTINPAPADTAKFKFFRRTPSIAAHGGKLYINDGTTIFYITPDDLTTQVLVDTASISNFVPNESNYQWLSGFAIKHGQIRYGIMDASGSTCKLTTNLAGTVLEAAPHMPAVKPFELGEHSIVVRYGVRHQVSSIPHAVRFVPDDDSLVRVSENGIIENIAFGKNETTGVWFYGPDGEADYLIVDITTAWWQWIIWICLFGWIWY